MAYPSRGFSGVAEFEARRSRRYPVPSVPVPPGLSPEAAARLAADPGYVRLVRSFTERERQAIAFGDYDALEGFSLKKFFKKVGKVLSTPAKIIGTVTGIIPIASAIGIRPKALGFKAASAQRQYRKIGQITRIVGGAALAVAGGIAFGPAILGAVKTGASVAWGGLKFLGGKLLAAPKALMEILGSKGIDPGTATPEQVIQAGQEAGYSFPSSSPVVNGQAMPASAAQADVSEGEPGAAETVAVQPQTSNVPLVVGGLAVAGLLALAASKRKGGH